MPDGGEKYAPHRSIDSPQIENPPRRDVPMA
jgi:hypothetical protein